MAYDYSKLRGRIIEKYGSCGAFAKVFPMRACELLDIEQQEMPDYFFKQKV